MPELIDTTLRDGLQTPGLLIDTHAALRIAHALDDAGLDELEVGMAAGDAVDRARVRALLVAPLRARRRVWCRTSAADLDAAADCGAEHVHGGMPVSDIHLAALGLAGDHPLHALPAWVAAARERFASVSVGLLDAARCPAERLRSVLRACIAAGADRIRLADSAGCWLPWQVADTVRDLRADCHDVCLGVHMHDDLGCAVANSVAALHAGADACDVTIDGIGERAGNAALASVVMAAHQAGLDDLRIDPRHLRRLSRQLANETGQATPRRQAVVGADCFAHASGLHARAQLADRRCYETIAPTSVGTETVDFVIGATCGKHAVRARLRAAGVGIDLAAAAALVPAIKRQVRRLGRPLTDADLIDCWLRHRHQPH